MMIPPGRPLMGETVYAPLIKKMIALGLTKGLAALGGYLIANGLTSDHGWAALSAEALPILVALAIEAYGFLTQMAMARVAQEAPKNTRFTEIKADVAALSVVDKMALVATQS